MKGETLSLEKDKQTYSPGFCLDAIEWAARKAGLSYGRFSAALTAEEEESICREYRAVVRKRQARERQRLETYKKGNRRGGSSGEGDGGTDGS